jgi:hypothetical protein
MHRGNEASRRFYGVTVTAISRTPSDQCPCLTRYADVRSAPHELKPQVLLCRFLLLRAIVSVLLSLPLCYSHPILDSLLLCLSASLELSIRASVSGF